MIPVTLQPEPADFDSKVRQKGHQWLKKKGIPFDAAPEKPSELPAYWQDSNLQLWESYSGKCAYLAIFFEWVSGASSTDHFVAKSQHAGMAYEWKNYRLSSLAANRNKNKFDDVLDPIGLKPNTFVLNLASGRISPNPNFSQAEREQAQKTIDRLGLDCPENRAMRARHFTNYLKVDWPLNHLAGASPFVFAEMVRQNLEKTEDRK